MTTCDKSPVQGVSFNQCWLTVDVCSVEDFSGETTEEIKGKKAWSVNGTRAASLFSMAWKKPTSDHRVFL